MDIAVVSHDTFWPLRGGGGIRVYWVAKYLMEKGHRVSIVAPFLHEEGLRKEFRSIRVLSLGKITRFVSFKEIVYCYLMTCALFKLLFRRFDVIYAHNVVAALPSVLVGMLRGIPVVFDMDDLLTGYSLNPIVNRLGPRMERWVARRAQRTIVTSKHVQRWSVDHAIRGTQIVGHGVDLTLFTPRKGQRKYITLTGGIEVNDGVLLIPYAAQKVLEEYPDETFLFVGEGKELDRLVLLVEGLNLRDHFIFRGWMDHKEIPAILAQSKIGLITSLTVSATIFSSPLRSYEYMAMELPFVAPDLEGIKEQVELSQAGILFQNGNADDLARAILTLLRDETLRETLGQNGRRYVLDHCDWMKNAETICRICQSEVKERK